jgi:hypothetical protein
LCQKPWRVWLNTRVLQEALARACPGDHRHGQDDSEHPGRLPYAFAKAIGEALLDREGAVPILHPVEHDETDDEHHPRTHMPYRADCPVCIGAKRPDKAHRRQEPADEAAGLPLVELDFCHLKDTGDQKPMPVLVAVDTGTGAIYAGCSPSQGRLDTLNIRGICRFLLEVGRTSELRIRTDHGSGALAVAQEVARIRGGVTVLETTPTASHSSLGHAERAVLTIGGELRALKASAETRLGVTIPVTSMLFSWLALHTSWLHNRFQPTRGQTAFHRVQQRVYTHSALFYAQPVMVRCQDLKGLPKLALRWAPGRWLGRVPDSDEDIVLTEFGIQNGRAVVPVHEADLPETLRAEALVKFLPGSTPTLRAPVDGAEEEPEPPAPLIPSGSGRTLTGGDYGPRAVALRDFHAARGHTAHCRACAEPGGKKHSHACRRRQWFWRSKRTAA